MSPAATLHVDRLLSNGAVDSTFPRVVAPMGSDLIATDIAGAADGGVLVTTQTEPTRDPCAAMTADGVGVGLADTRSSDGHP